MDQQTKAALKKQDEFVSTTTHGLEWASENRRTVMMTAGVLLAALVVVVVGAVIYNNRCVAASTAFGDAIAEYQTPLAPTGEAVPPGVKTYPSAIARSKAANALFTSVADKYTMTPAGKNARYFAGMTAADMGDSKNAEAAFKTVAGGWDHDLGGLAKVALASLYRNTNRNAEAETVLKQLIASPTTTVPAAGAQLQLADLYTAEGKTADAKALYAKIKDADAKSAAAQIAQQKLGGNAPGAPGAAAAPQMQQ